MMMKDADVEDTVVFEEEGQIRSLRGTIIKEDDNFITIERRDGTFKIAIKTVRKIIYRNNHGGGS